MTEKLILIPRLFGATAPLPPQIGPYVRRRLDVDVDEHDVYTIESADPAIRHALVKVTAAVLAKDLPELTWSHTEVVKFALPDGWWQHWKADHADTWWAGWIARRWQPRFRTHATEITYRVDVSRAALFPEATDFQDDVVQFDVLGPPYLHLDKPRTKIITRDVTDVDPS